MQPLSEASAHIEKISVVILAMLGKFKHIKSKKQFEDERSMIDTELEGSTGLTMLQ
ncbi:MAG: hypothetical protein RQ743_03325 [Bacteroidales bacterium]|nr:hypothetical protein [Bacteroidales bacterium]